MKRIIVDSEGIDLLLDAIGGLPNSGEIFDKWNGYNPAIADECRQPDLVEPEKPLPTQAARVSPAVLESLGVKSPPLLEHAKKVIEKSLEHQEGFIAWAIMEGLKPEDVRLCERQTIDGCHVNTRWWLERKI